LAKNNLKYAIDRVENECIPPESENKSILKPNIKAISKKITLFFFNGYKKIKMI
jgi:hypothetical protein